ncbi:TPA: trypsin-like peptidase domain-containing protein [Raoultella ornithinolytica]
MVSVSHSVSKSTVRIESDVPGGISVGTGFWFAFHTEGSKIIPLLVTNKHVIANSTSIRMRLNVSSSSDSNLRFHELIVNNPSHFLYHPDPNIDMCALPMGHVLNDLERNDINLDAFFFTERHFLNENYVTPVEEVFMTGYPSGLWDSVNNLPITRRGITATSVRDDWQGRSEFMIDMACFGGSSGSPVYIMNDGEFVVKGGWATGTRLIFLGLLYAGPTIDANGIIKIVDVPTAFNAVVSTKLMMNLGNVIKAENINGLRPLLGI